MDWAQGPQSGEGDTEGWDIIPTSHQVFIRCSSGVSPRSGEGGIDLDCIFAADKISSGVSPQSGEGDVDFDCIFTGD